MNRKGKLERIQGYLKGANGASDGHMILDGGKMLDEIDGYVLEELAQKLCSVVYGYKNNKNVTKGLKKFCEDDSNLNSFASRFMMADEACLGMADYQRALAKDADFALQLPNFESDRYKTYYLPETSIASFGLRVEMLSEDNLEDKSIFDFYSNGDAEIIDSRGSSNPPTIEGLEAAEEIMMFLFEKIADKEQAMEKPKAI